MFGPNDKYGPAEQGPSAESQNHGALNVSTNDAPVTLGNFQPNQMTLRILNHIYDRTGAMAIAYGKHLALQFQGIEPKITQFYNDLDFLPNKEQDLLNENTVIDHEFVPLKVIFSLHDTKIYKQIRDVEKLSKWASDPTAEAVLGLLGNPLDEKEYFSPISTTLYNHSQENGTSLTKTTLQYQYSVFKNGNPLKQDVELTVIADNVSLETVVARGEFVKECIAADKDGRVLAHPDFEETIGMGPPD